MQRLSTVTMGEHRGRQRIYMQGKWLAKGNFTAGASIAMHVMPGSVVIQLSTSGERTVSSKKNGTIPVIDLNTDQLNNVFKGCKTLQIKLAGECIYITPARTERNRITRVRNGLEGALFAGGGLLSQAATQAGFKPAFAVEWDERYAEIFEKNHLEARMFNCSISEVPLDELPKVELLTVGIPCEPFSMKRRQKDGLVPEAHELGDMVFWALRIIDHCNPHTVVVEEVPGFMEAGAGWILRHALMRMGYTVDSRVIDSFDYNGLTRRRRAVVVATTNDTVVWPAQEEHTRHLGDILDADGEWFDRASKPWLFEHWEKQEAKGNNFSNQKFDATDECVGAVGKRYFSQQGDGVVVRHPDKPDTYRWLSLAEVKRLHGVPESYYTGEAKCTAGEVLGQGVVVTTFEKIIRCTTGRN